MMKTKSWGFFVSEKLDMINVEDFQRCTLDFYLKKWYYLAAIEDKMKNQIPMNSSALQEAHPEIYREFFSKCPIVVSAPRNFFWGGEHGVMYGGISVLQAVPIRIFVGIEPFKTPGIHLGKLLVGDIDGNFIKSEVSKLIDQDFQKFLSNEFDLQGRGCKIHILSDQHLCHGFGSRGGLVVPIMTSLKIFSGGLSKSDVDGWKKLKLSELSKNKKFNEIMRLSWKAEIASNLYNASGAQSFVSLIGGVSPIIFYKKQIVKNAPLPNRTPDLNYPNFFDYGGAKMTEVAEQAEFIWPIDFGVIYSGIQKLTGSVVRSTHGTQMYLDEVSSDIKKLNGNLDIADQKRNIFRHYIENIQVNALEIVSSMKRLFFDGTSPSAFKNFFRAINLTQKSFYFLDIIPEQLEEITNAFDYEFRKNGIHNFAIKTTGSGGGGSIVFAGHLGAFEEKLETIVENISKRYDLPLNLDYATWKSGYDNDGVRIEQNLQEGVYSQFISESSILIKEYSRDSFLTSNLSSLEEFEKERPKIDLLLDAIEGDVYVRGKKLTSKEIPASSTTVEVLSILLENIGKSIDNMKLPESSYSQDRNEMQSKIVSPLVKIIKKQTGKTFPLEIQGGLTNYKMKLKPSIISVKVLNRIF